MKSSAVSEGSGGCARAGGTAAEGPVPCPAPGKCLLRGGGAMQA